MVTWIKCKGKEGIKNCLQIGFWITVDVLGSSLLFSAKNNENAIFLINIHALRCMQKAVKVSFY